MGAHIVTLVPWRPGDALRERHWEFVRPHLESLGYDLFTGDAPGTWARAAACNRAAAKAGDWDIALVADADSILEPEAVKATIAHVAKTRGAARPHDHRWMLSLGATKMLMSRGVKAIGRHLHSRALGGGALVVHRQAWDGVGGYPEEFVGWGHEDTAMNIALVSNGPWELMPGNTYHLFHPPANMRTPEARANRALMEHYQAAHATQIARASRRAGFDLNTVL